ncbi:MAG: hypothetical protein D6706_16825, partial [Chloroflexi bacterium]
ANNEPELYILEQRSRMDTFLVVGTAVSAYQPEDALVVYDEIVPDVEEPVALLRVVAANPDSLTAQIVLHNPERPIHTRFRVDAQVDQVSRGELVPFDDAFVAYFIGSGQVRVRPGVTLAEGDLLQAYAPVVVDGLTLDYVQMFPPTRLHVSEVGVKQAVAVTTLADGAWPPVGTVLALADEGGMETAVPPATATRPTAPTTTPQPTETPYAGPCLLESLEAAPPSPQVVGTAVTVRMRGTCETGVRAIRLFINGEWVGEKGGHIAPPEEFNYFWMTEELEPGDYVLTAEVATWGDDDWQFTSSQTITYTLTSAP